MSLALRSYTIVQAQVHAMNGGSAAIVDPRSSGDPLLRGLHLDFTRSDSDFELVHQWGMGAMCAFDAKVDDAGTTTST